MADPPTLPREAVPPENVRQMFGIGGCLPHLGGSSPRKSSEMFGNVRKMFGTCSERARPLHQPSPRAGHTCPEHFPNNFRSFSQEPPPRGGREPPVSEHFPNMFQTFSGGTPYRGKVGGAATPVPNIFRTFPNISEDLQRGGATIQGARHPTIPNIVRTLLKEPPPRGEAGEPPPSSSEHFLNIFKHIAHTV